MKSSFYYICSYLLLIFVTVYLYIKYIIYSFQLIDCKSLVTFISFQNKVKHHTIVSYEKNYLFLLESQVGRPWDLDLRS